MIKILNQKNEALGPICYKVILYFLYKFMIELIIVEWNYIVDKIHLISCLAVKKYF